MGHLLHFFLNEVYKPPPPHILPVCFSCSNKTYVSFILPQESVLQFSLMFMSDLNTIFNLLGSEQGLDAF